MATKEMLLNDFSISGDNMDNFKKIVTDMSDATDVLTVKGREITFLSLCDIEKYQTPGKTTFYILSEEYVDDFLTFGERLHLGSIKNEELGEDLLSEARNTTGLIALIDGQKYLISRSTLTTLAQRACVSGDSTVKRNNLARDLHIADALFSRNEWINLVYRHAKGEDSINKIFAAFSSDFILNRQDIIIKALEHEEFPYDSFRMKDFHIDNSITELSLYLPKAIGELQSGLIIRNSDIGNSSLIVRNVVFTGNSYIITKESSLRHDRGFTFERFLDKTLKESKAFYDASDIIEQLTSFKDIPVFNYGKLDLSSEQDSEENFCFVQDLIVSGVFELYRPLIPNKSFKNVCKYLSDEIEGSKQYTFFDIAKFLISVPEHLVTLDYATLVNLRKAAADIPTYLNERLAKMMPDIKKSA